MKNNNRLYFGIGALLALFLILAFVIPFAHTAVFWVAFAATLVSFALAAFEAVKVLRIGKGMRSRILNWPILRTAAILLAVQFVLFFVQAALSQRCPLRASVAAEAVFIIVSLLLLLARAAAAIVVEENEKARPAQTSAMKTLRAQAQALANENPSYKAAAEALRLADPVSNAATGEVEEELRQALENKLAPEEVLKLIEKRKLLCKSGK